MSLPIKANTSVSSPMHHDEQMSSCTAQLSFTCCNIPHQTICHSHLTISDTLCTQHTATHYTQTSDSIITLGLLWEQLQLPGYANYYCLIVMI